MLNMIVSASAASARTLKILSALCLFRTNINCMIVITVAMTTNARDAPAKPFELPIRSYVFFILDFTGLIEARVLKNTVWYRGTARGTELSENS